MTFSIQLKYVSLSVKNLILFMSVCHLVLKMWIHLLQMGLALSYSAQRPHSLRNLNYFEGAATLSKMALDITTFSNMVFTVTISILHLWQVFLAKSNIFNLHQLRRNKKWFEEEKITPRPLHSAKSPVHQNISLGTCTFTRSPT